MFKLFSLFDIMEFVYVKFPNCKLNNSKVYIFLYGMSTVT